VLQLRLRIRTWLRRTTIAAELDQTEQLIYTGSVFAASYGNTSCECLVRERCFKRRADERFISA